RPEPPSEGRRPCAWSSTVVWACPLIARLPGISRSRSIKHRARDALGLADLRLALPIARTSVSGKALDFHKPRCREVSRPVGPFGPLASRAPSVGAGGKRD